MKIKSFVLGSVGAFWLAVLGIVGYGLAAGDKPKTDSKANEMYTLSQVATHSKASDCWMVIDGKVYDFTAYIEQHPTKPEVLTKHCGTEATEAYRTKGGVGRSHYPGVDKQKEQYQIGRLRNDRSVPNR